MRDFKQLFCAAVPSISTPFAEDGSIDYAQLEIMIENYISWGYRVLMLTAGDSHYACMSDAEITEVTLRVLKQCAGRAEVIAADRYFATPEALKFAELCREHGACCYMALPPDWGGSLTPATLTEHYRLIGKIIPVMCVTNIFSPRGAMGFGMEVCRRIADMPEVVAVKDDVCFAFGRAMSMLLGDKKAVIAGGQKQTHFDLASYGACGHLTTFGRFMPEPAKVYWEAMQSGNLELAKKIVQQIDIPYFNLICSFSGGFNAGIYGSLEIAKVAKRYRRFPYLTITDSDFERLRSFHDRVPEILQSILEEK